ncbi:MAG: sorbosone dehydrogenase family protein [Armatimonadetes bacterium]|jgi:glucose/arabinose dehydrogenase|nr:sorbosone dehydrogenase family protein [Armatimonadota bacterium]HOM82467.1 sorbosone dehydrogenase family protein [Armatimonadota bacterium]
MERQPLSRSVLILAVALAGALLAGCRGGGGITTGSQAAPAARPGENAPARSGAEALPVEERLRAPEGFRVEQVAQGLQGVRLLAFSPDGRLFATQPRSGRVTLVPIGGGAPTAWATGLNRPHGIAFHDGFLYVAETDAVVRWRYQPGAQRAPGAPERVASLPGGGSHWTRTLRFGPDGKMYVSIGSTCNVCIEDDPRRAAILQFAPDGSGERIFASGLRNTVGFDWDAQGRLWGVDNGTDNMGDNFPPEELNLIQDGGFYGWPYAHGDCVPDPRYGSRRPEMVERCIPPAFKITAHSAPLGIIFYQAEQFPEAYRGDAFITLHGSWNRSAPSGYKVIRIHFSNGQPVAMSDFITGFGQGRGAWARPVGIVTGPDGSLYLSDDRAGSIWRVRYTGSSGS